MKLRALSIAFSLSCATLSTLAGCAADTSSPAEEDGEELVDQAEDDLTGGPSNFGYFIVTRRDTRRCVSPLCGGYFVKRVNQATTRCADGSLQDECYVSAIELKNVGLSTREEEPVRGSVESGKALIKAATYKKKFNGRPIGTLKAKEAWVGATGAAVDGSFYRVADNGIRCAKAPCPATTAYQLNGHEDYRVGDVRLDNTPIKASEESLNLASHALATREGVLVGGGVALPKCLPTARCSPFVTVQEFYLRVTPTEGKGCGGFRAEQSACNADQFCKYQAADICGAADAGGVCQYKSEICPQVFKQVCGCDGKTYGNECKAASAGTSVSSFGPCKK